MRAADVLTEARRAWRVSYDPAVHENVDLDAAQVAALLAHGEQGVAILPDGTLWTLDGVGYSASGRYDSPLYRLVPLSAEAGDEVAWSPAAARHACSAEAGDTDGT